MRPLRLVPGGFGWHRKPAGVGFFALTGPTGAGEGTVTGGQPAAPGEA
jgi:hypothetical protein